MPSYGLDKGVIPGYLTWLVGAVQGDFGDSWEYTVPVLEKFGDVIGLSVIMGVISFILQLIIAIPLGIVAATKQYSKLDYGITAGSPCGYIPANFFLCHSAETCIFRKAGMV